MNKNVENISQNDLNRCTEILKSIDEYYSERIVGQTNLKNSLLIALLANGHILLESVPGLAKTTAAKVLTEAVSGKFSRIQCTPDLLPSDIVGTQVFDYADNKFQTRIGPIYANFVLLDEINRSSAKTQSASLEAMQEKQITIDGTIYKLPEPFIVIATQNPIEQEGTYMLAEAQLDRFLIKEVVNYPTATEEIEDLNYLQGLVEKVYIDESVKKYITQIILATRFPKNYIDPQLASYISLGSSTRGSIAFMQCSKALALMKGRNYVTPDDVKDLRYSILRHRIALNFSAIADNVSVEQLIDAIFGVIPTP